ncbi:MAG: Asp-tRNA(Asn)/Glu-tRNA(Gln) amidotransferase subunit GatB [Anaerolineae bacterium]|nr:Asp-tRNA(Asn)/Glu-tRNA(Gln) amidotransferase subunit GatB [Anaerolineae bacterium]
MNKYEPVIGMEIHAEMATLSKMFCGCRVVDTTTAEPNTTICPVCTGLPGAMPVLNRRAVEMAMLVGLALHCQINEYSNFARKNYFYPDLPKGYQISQYDYPVATRGWLDIDTESEGPVRIGVTRAHMEEDTAKLFHFKGDFLDPEDYTLIDFNRSGIPLLEIVSEPDMRSVEQALAYATKIREILRYLGVNAGDMEKGILRFEANVSVRLRGSRVLGTRTEIKNLNSFRALTGASAYEIQRQIQVLEAGGTVVQETLGWDDARGVTFSQRSKEEAHDYRYFPEPDLPPLSIDRAWVDELIQTLPELPDAKYQRFVTELQVPEGDARILVAERALAEYFEAAVTAYGGPAVNVSKWMVGELAYLMNRENTGINQVQVKPENLVQLLKLLDDKTLNQNSAKEVLGEMFETGKTAGAVVQEKGLVQISDADALAQIVAQVISENPQQVQTYLDGKEGILGWLMGQVMRLTRGRAAPQTVRSLLIKALDRSRQ